MGDILFYQSLKSRKIARYLNFHLYHIHTVQYSLKSRKFVRYLDFHPLVSFTENWDQGLASALVACLNSYKEHSNSPKFFVGPLNFYIVKSIINESCPLVLSFPEKAALKSAAADSPMLPPSLHIIPKGKGIMTYQKRPLSTLIIIIQSSFQSINHMML